MSPLQKIAMGLVIVVGRALFPPNPSPDWQVYDALPDPIGWLLVISGVRALGAHLDVDVVRWFASLPQLAFCLVLALMVGRAGADREPPDDYVAKRFGLLVWGFALLAVLPVVALGGEVTRLENPTQLASVLVNLALIYLLFRVHRREWLGGPGPLEVGLPSGS